MSENCKEVAEARSLNAIRGPQHGVPCWGPRTIGKRAMVVEESEMPEDLAP